LRKDTMVWIRFKAEGKNGPYYGKMDIILPEIYLEEEALNNAALEKARSLKVSEIKWLHHKITDEDAKVTEVRLAYKIVNGTYYDYRTSDDVIAVLENARMNG